MRRDVRLLGDILGEVIRESDPKTGPDLLADVERLRRAVIAARDQERRAEDPAVDAIAALVGSWDLDRAEEVARAFTVYFHLANLAEEHQRIRLLRERDAGHEPVRESLAAAVIELSHEVGPAHLLDLLGDLRVHLVLTAHPTEARRRAVVAVLRRINELLGVLDDPRTGAAERAEARRGLREDIDLLWRTSQLRVKAMDPIDEVRTVMTAFDETLFRVVPAVYRELDRALAGPGAEPATPVSAYLRFGSWVGADRDGNPFVTAQVTRETATIQADHVLRALETATARIGRALTVHEATTPASPGLRRALAAAAAAHPELLAEITARSPQEPYRTYLLYLAQRISATRTRDADLAYPGPEDFRADLRVVQESLAAAGAGLQARGELQNLIWQAETFGFHLAGLEVRQHSEVHARVLRELRAAGPPGLDHHADRGAETQEVLATFRAIGWIQDRFGVAACHRYVVSFTRSAGDIAAVFELARYAADGGRTPVLDVVPLFESAIDLANAPDVLTGMLELPPVAERLDATGGRLEAMLGYSDSAKELGPASATLRLFDTQARLAGWAAAHHVKLTLFHGRGGALGRGGGPAGRAVLAQAPGSVNGSFKVTEQGEVIFARYGQQAIAKRHLEQVSSAVLLASSERRAERTAAAAASYRDIADRIDRAACATFRGLVEADGFADWFARISPLGEIGGLRIGSRPAKRGLAAAAGGQTSPAPTQKVDLADLRAIPWVFAWSQTRVNLPGWFGLGSGLAAIGSDPDGIDVLRRAYREWPLFGVLLDNAEMSLAKTDRPIAARYLALGGRDDLTAQVLAEYDLTKRLVLAVTGHDRLLADRPVLSRAVALRDPYVDALSYLQLRALSALRAPSEHQDRERVERLLLLTVNGVAAGLQNTG
ncbi:MAG TPA: phosphoenolpyruvate carboxylase [Streptosporangiaceae bacterium]|nr:phosphoenolpyruvate carboxylase [Streptosporangiaceae bacterium]